MLQAFIEAAPGTIRQHLKSIGKIFSISDNSRTSFEIPGGGVNVYGSNKLMLPPPPTVPQSDHGPQKTLPAGKFIKKIKEHRPQQSISESSDPPYPSKIPITKQTHIRPISSTFNIDADNKNMVDTT